MNQVITPNKQKVDLTIMRKREESSNRKFYALVLYLTLYPIWLLNINK